MTMSMATCVAIATYRYKMIVGLYAGDHLVSTGIILTATWLASIIPASIFLYVMVLQPAYEPEYGIFLYNICIEVWPFAWGRQAYTAFTIIEQYCIPLLTIGIVHSRILRFININRMNRKYALQLDRENKRHRKTVR